VARRLEGRSWADAGRFASAAAALTTTASYNVDVPRWW
jgi:sugar/nucleoside kinase (ribokinase family)